MIMNKQEQNMMEILPSIENKNQLPGIILADTTSRDWLQSLPWWNYWTKQQRAGLTQKMSEAWIHHIEVWFPAMEWDPEYQAVQHTANTLWESDSVIFGLARLIESDIKNTIQAIAWAQYKWVHTFVWTSPEHLSTFSFWTDEILTNIWKRVSQIREAWYIAQFSAEDATRTDPDFLVEVYEKAIQSGAQILNIPDTLGFYDAYQYMELMKHLSQKFPHVILSAHAHNDKSQAEQSALLSLSKWYAQRVEWTLFGIGERAWNTDLAALIPILRQDNEAYQHINTNLLKNPAYFREVLQYMEEISGLHGRPVSPWYWYEAIVNRSWVHQAKIAQLKESYIWCDDVWLGLWWRPQTDISALSWHHWVYAKLQSLWIDADLSNLPELTKLYRYIFSPDTNPDDIKNVFPEISSDFLYQAGIKINEIRKEARELKNTERNLIRWNQETDEIIFEVYQEYVKQK